MKKIIEVYDDIFPTQMSETIENVVRGKIKDYRIPLYYAEDLSERYVYKGEAGYGNTFVHKEEFLLNQGSFLLHPLYYFIHYKNYLLTKILQGRLYLQPPQKITKTYSPHTDSNESHYVCLYYVTDSDGDTVFYGVNGDEIKRVSPKKGRIIFFDGSIYHAASQPTTTLRAVLNYGFNFINLE